MDRLRQLDGLEWAWSSWDEVNRLDRLRNFAGLVDLHELGRLGGRMSLGRLDGHGQSWTVGLEGFIVGET